jgi:4-hydroxy-tetrahydrodipicolinate synthase
MFSGAMTALVTPFREGEVDETALRELVERQIAGGISGLVPCGTTGESVTLRGNEHEQVVRVVVEQANGRVPVVAGAGTNDTHKSIALTRLAKDAGADGVLLVTPYYNKPTQAGLYAHFRAILSEVSIPAILYDIPSRTNVALGLDTLERLLEMPEVVALKDASGNVHQAQQCAVRFGSRLSVLSGDDALTLPLCAVGARGVVSVASNLLPDRVSELVACALRGDFAGARERHLRLLPVYESLFAETNPGPIKGAMADAGWLAPEIRLPLVWPSEATRAGVAEALRAAGVQPS